MMASLAVPAFADPDPANAFGQNNALTSDQTAVGFVEVSSSGGTGTSELHLKADAATFKVRVPSVLPVYQDADAVERVASNAQIENKSNGPVKVTGVDVTAQSPWTIVDFATDFKAVKMDTKQFGMTFNSKDVFDEEADIAETIPVINGQAVQGFNYAAEVASQSEATTAHIANAVFTIAWDEAAPAVSYPRLVSMGTLKMGDTAVNTDHDGTHTNVPNFTTGSTLTITDSNGNADEAINWIQVSDSLYIADRNLVDKISWDDLNGMGYVDGTTTTTIGGKTYKVRLLTGGTSSEDAVNSEWNQYIVNGLNDGDNATWHWYGCYSWCQDVYSNGASFRVSRGCNSVGYWLSGATDNRNVSDGWRPALELVG